MRENGGVRRNQSKKISCDDGSRLGGAELWVEINERGAALTARGFTQ